MLKRNIIEATTQINFTVWTNLEQFLYLNHRQQIQIFVFNHEKLKDQWHDIKQLIYNESID